jgi:hypothetical protein
MGRRAAGGRPRLNGLARARRRLRRPLPLLLCIDVEPDDRQVDPDDPAWAGLERCLERVGELRERIAHLAEGPTRLNWEVRADPQIEAVHGHAGWAFDHYAEAWERLRADGDEIGIHAHCWRAEPDGGWFVDHADGEWTERCVASAIAAYRDAFGAPPPSSRGGDRFLSDAIIALLEGRGVAADLTVEPRMPAAPSVGDDARTTGSLPDYREAPEVAYHPSAENFLVPGHGEVRLLELPLTSGGPEVLYPWMDAQQFSQRLHERLAEPVTHLAFAIRSDLALDDAAWELAVSNLERVPHITGVVAERRLRSTVVSEAVAQLA